MSWADALKLLAMVVLIAVIALLGRYQISVVPSKPGILVLVLDRWTSTVSVCDEPKNCRTYPVTQVPSFYSPN